MSDKAYALFEEQQQQRGIDLEQVKAKLKALSIETPSWGYGDSGTRFKVFQKTGVPRDPFEKLEDAAQVHAVTGLCPSVAIHIPWDTVDNYGKLRSHAESLGLQIGAESQPVSRRGLHARQCHQCRPGHPPQGHQPFAGMRGYCEGNGL